MESHSAFPPLTLALVIPCYNEGAALGITIPSLQSVLQRLEEKGLIKADSFIALVDDGSRDNTWDLIAEAAARDKGRVRGVRLAANVGHQGALMAGLTYVTGRCQAAISLDADLQHDVETIPTMIERYNQGAHLVLGVRDSREVDSLFKGASALGFYKIMQWMGVKLVTNHADFRLMSDVALRNLQEFQEVHLFLRGLPPLLHRRVETVSYICGERVAGESKYSVRKMLSLAWNGITSFSTVPLRLVTMTGGLVFLFSLLMIFYALWRYWMGEVIAGWASIVVPLYLLGGLLMLSIGIVGEYLGKLFIEAKRRPRFLIETIAGEKDDSALTLPKFRPIP